MPRKQQKTLYIGDNLPIMLGMESESVDLIYTDPPFKSETFRKGTTEKHSFDDTWSDYQADYAHAVALKFQHPQLWQMITLARDMHSLAMQHYLEFMAPRIVQMHRLLKPTGSLYLHCDPSANKYLGMILDCVFGARNFRNEIIWRIGWVSGYKTQKQGWIRNHDVILYYTKSPEANPRFNKEYIPYPDGYVRRDGKKPTGQGIPIEDTWNCNQADVLDSIMIKSFSTEKTGYATQKPLALVERIIKASSNEGDLVLDPFCGCATACVAAAQLNRNWIGIDQNEEAIKILNERFKKSALTYRYETNRPVVHESPKGMRAKADGTAPKAIPLPKRKATGYKKIAKNKAKAILLQLDYAERKTPYCRGCFQPFDEKLLEVDHILAKSKGGLDELENFQLLCGPCNTLKSNKDMEFLYRKLDERTALRRQQVTDSQKE